MAFLIESMLNSSLRASSNVFRTSSEEFCEELFDHPLFSVWVCVNEIFVFIAFE